MEDLSLILWRERELLDTLLYKLEIEQLVLAGGRSRWLPSAAREVETVLDAIRETELLRAVAVPEPGRLASRDGPGVVRLAAARDGAREVADVVAGRQAQHQRSLGPHVK